MKVLASDYDKTLLFSDEDKPYFRPEDVVAIKHFQSLGNLFGVCTGRSYYGVSHFNPDNLEYDFYILCSGAKILDSDGHVIFQKFIDKKIAYKIFRQYSSVHTSIVYREQVYLLNHDNKLPEHAKLITSFDEVGDELESFSLHFNNDGEANVEYQKIKSIFSDVIDVYQNERHLDFAPKGCSKGSAVLKIIDYFGIDEKDMAVIGDSWNDIPMLKQVENSFTFNRSPETVKEIAKYLVDGIDECIDKLI